VAAVHTHSPIVTQAQDAGAQARHNEAMPAVQEVLADRYELLEVLGRGGMGVVFRARDRVLNRVVAVKVLASDRAEDETFVARFEREALAAAALNHPNVVAVFDTGNDNATRFIVMECVSGSSLAQLLRRGGPLPPPRVAEIGRAIASALDAAHRAGIIHRDVKPANVMVDDRGAVKVLDFGIARAAGDASLTQTAMVLGSAPYLAPEVTRGERADERSDIYSLGCVLYQMLTGRPPFQAEVPAAVLHQHNSASPRPPRELCSSIPQTLEKLVLEMLAKSPSARPQTARQALETLSAADGRPLAHRRRIPAPAASTTPPTRVLARTRPHKSRVGATLAVVTAAIAVGALALLLGSSHPKRRVARTGTAHVKAARTRAARSRATQSRRPSAATTPATTPPSTATLPAAAAALTRLALQDLAAGSIDQHASQQLLAHLQDVSSSFGKANGDDAIHKLDDLSKQVAQLGEHGDIQSAALPAITLAVDRLGSALAQGAPARGTPAPGPTPAPPKPPKHGKKKGEPD
jgi:eukaryotic-like serine/threonine-protein kinase